MPMLPDSHDSQAETGRAPEERRDICGRALRLRAKTRTIAPIAADLKFLPGLVFARAVQKG
jgi:hypothetical protein